MLNINYNSYLESEKGGREKNGFHKGNFYNGSCLHNNYKFLDFKNENLDCLALISVLREGI